MFLLKISYEHRESIFNTHLSGIHLLQNYARRITARHNSLLNVT